LNIYIYIYEQYNPETARRNTSKLKHSIPIEKTKHLPKRNWQPWAGQEKCGPPVYNCDSLFFCQSISNGEAKWIAKNKKPIFWLFFACFAHSKGKAKQNAKMSFLSHKCYSYISLQIAKINKVGSLKK